MDVDGVLTDGKLHFGNDGAEFKTFDVQDGHGIAMAQRAGLIIGFISGRRSKATTRRAKDLGVRLVLQAPVNKMQLIERVKRKHGFGDEVAVISIELNESIWKIDAIKLGDQKSNLNDAGVPIHAIKNTGTVSVAVDIGYGPMAYGLIHPGREQGLDTFVTTVETGFMLNGATLFGIIPPNDRIKVAEITPGNGFPMRLTYAAPTALSENNQGMSVTYEIRAYPVDQNK